MFRETENRFANPPAARYSPARKNRREPRNDNYDLAFILINGMNAHASDRKSGAFLFPRMKRKDAKTQRRGESMPERGCVRSTSRSASDFPECCGWVCDHSCAPSALRLCVFAPLR
jgi:hypothetical protein